PFPPLLAQATVVLHPARSVLRISWYRAETSARHLYSMPSSASGAWFPTFPAAPRRKQSSMLSAQNERRSLPDRTGTIHARPDSRTGSTYALVYVLESPLRKSQAQSRYPLLEGASDRFLPAVDS